MRLIDFLIYLLQAHAQTLSRLAAFFGEEKFIEILEDAGEKNSNQLPPSQFADQQGAQILWLDSPQPGSNSNAYAELEGAVRDMGLPALLEFHLWAYPHYRAFIESPHDLNSRIKTAPHGDRGDAGALLVDEACQHAQAWVQTLGIPPAVAPAAERAAQIPWIRFSTEFLKRIGKRTLCPVY